MSYWAVPGLGLGRHGRRRQRQQAGQGLHPTLLETPDKYTTQVGCGSKPLCCSRCIECS